MSRKDERIASEVRLVFEQAIAECPHPCKAGNNPISYTIDKAFEHTCESEFYCHIIALCESYSALLRNVSAWDIESVVERFYGELISVCNAFDQHVKAEELNRQRNKNLARYVPPDDKLATAYKIEAKKSTERGDLFYAGIARHFQEWKARGSRFSPPCTQDC